MNRKNLNQIFDAYIQHFELLNDSRNDESYKWRAIIDFHEAFDLTVSDNALAGMLKEARNATVNLIDSYTQPFGGLVELAKRESGTVRTMLVALLKDDGGDLVVRQNKIDRPLREFCVSVFRQNQEYHVFNVHDGGVFPLSTSVPEG